VRRLAEAGAVLVAKLTTGALAYGDVWDGGLTRNPWNLAEGSSGSSAGPGAATAAGLVGFSLGTETYGSIVSPCMVCGTTGLRPTFGRVARTGTMPLCWSLDKIGPICRTVEDTIAVLAVIHGADVGDPASRTVPLRFDARAKIAGTKVGFVRAHFDGDGANAIDRAALDALKRIGAQLVPIELPALPWDALATIVFAEAAASFEDLTLDGRDDRLRWQTAEAWPNIFRAWRFMSAIDLIAADRLRRQAMTAFAERFAEVDIIAGPSYASPLLLASNCTGHPSLTLRAGFETRPPQPLRDGSKSDPKEVECPRGFTLIGRLYEEGALCRVGLALEREVAVGERRPPGFA
jgi:Asp-tRNA(Asn)/Glu-tRNA(Gln) amidotransferase A subunit family amidase